MKPKDLQPLSIDKKYNLTLFEASEYFNIGINTLRDIVKQEGFKFTTKVGENKVLIIRHKFEEFIDSHYNLTS